MEGIPVDLDEITVKTVTNDGRLCEHGRTSAGIISILLVEHMEVSYAMGVPPVVIHFCLGFSMKYTVLFWKHPFLNTFIYIRYFLGLPEEDALDLLQDVLNRGENMGLLEVFVSC